MQGIKEIENRLLRTEKKLQKVIPALINKVSLTAGEIYTIFQGIIGFAGALASKNPFAAASSLLGLAGTEAKM